MEEKEDSGGLGSETIVTMYKDINQFEKKKLFRIKY